LRKTALAIAASLVAIGGFFVPAAAAAAPANPKVVIIVGATEGTTSSYRSRADAEYAEAIKYTTNVVKVYSPNATWSAVKAATRGASIVIYHGHGNGWPSPYTYDPAYTTKNGFGLNATAGAGDNNNKYYGEPYIDDLELAPNAVVMFGNLCYASGNGEPGSPEPTISVARQRADNYAAAFIRAGARGVIAEGHLGLSYYIRALFTTHATLDSLWRAAPNFHNHVIPFSSSRNPGSTGMLDPDSASTGFYRSIVGRLTTTTDSITGAAYASTDAHPASFVVPGAAQTTVNAGLYPDYTMANDPTTGAPPALLGAGRSVRIDAQVGTARDGSAAFAVRTLDGSASGIVAGSQLSPRDSAPPDAWQLDSRTTFSPNGDGVGDVADVSGRFSESVSWQVLFLNASGATLATSAGTGSTFSTGWNGRIGASTAPDGTYSWHLSARDPWGNTPFTRSGNLTLDLTPPTLTSLGLEAGRVTFSPNGDRVADSLSIPYATNEPGTAEVTVVNAAGSVVRTFTAVAPGGATSTSWGGESNGGGIVSDGLYSVAVRPRDAAGNLGSARTAQVGVYGTMTVAIPAPAIFYPQDGDRLAKTSRLGFVLRSAARVDVTIETSGGAVVFRRYAAASLPAGTHNFNWNGRNQAGRYVAGGTYYIRVRATDGTLSSNIRRSVVVNGFSLAPSDATPARGQSIRLTIVSAENLARNPRVTISQPGVQAWSVATTKTGTRTYRATIRFKSGRTGTATMTVRGTDTSGGSNSARLSLPLH
jgi:flagellar hook assembly protein FlgD